VIFIGDIPLPVVNKEGNRYVSMFPYTDFVDKAYIYNPTTDDFERNNTVVFPKIEAWHGVIKEPCFSDYADQCPATSTYGRNEIAKFLDKNHLYYLKNPDFYNVDKKMFFADLINEEKKLVPEIYKYYLRYLDGLEDQSYMRYNKFWAYDVLQSQTAGMDMGENQTSAGDDFAASLDSPEIFQDMPDTYAKQIIDQSLIPYYSLMKKFVSVLNNWADYTGRYSPTDILNVPVLITMKDEAAKYYLKSANDALEKKINEIAEKIQEPITILEYSKLTGELAQNPDGESPAPFSINLTGKERPADTVDNLVIRYHYKNEVDGKVYVNGIPTDIIESPKLCSVYLGSTQTNYFDDDNNFNPKAVDGEYSILTRSMRSFDPSTATTAHTIGVNTRSILLEDEETYGDYFHGELIEDNLDYGVPAFYPNYLTGRDNKYKNPWEGTLQKGDIIVEVNEYPLKPKFTLKEAVEQVYQNKVTRYKEDKKAERDVDLKGTVRIKFYRNGVLQPTAVKTYQLVEGRSSGDKIIIKDVLQKGDSDSAMFALYLQQDDDSKGKAYYGFGKKGFDISAGCNFQSSGQNSNRCFYNVAMMPVLSPAGSETFIKDMNNDDALMFPENIQKHYDEDLQKAVNIADDSGHRYSFQYPDGYSYEDIDKLYMDSCFNGIPSIESDNREFDSNPYSYPLDSRDTNGNAIEQDVYGKLLRYIGEFVSLGEMEVDVQKYNPDTKEMETDSNKKINADSIALPPTNRAPAFFKDDGDKSNNIGWLDIDSLGDNYEDIVLNSEPSIYLASFSSRYGLFDKTDNDNDGQIDEFDERTFGLPQKNLGEIFRKMLSKNATYTIPAEAFPESTGITSDATLKVEVKTLKTLSSVILHNEPTNYTISEAVKSMATKSLPIDNPRYVAFQSLPKAGLNYGRIEKIVYPNLFRINNAAQLMVDIGRLASDIADMPGSYRVFGRGANESSYTKEQIKDKIVFELYNVVKGTADSPASGIDLIIADEQKLADFTKWAHMSVDDKHEYILKYYLNPNKDAYIQDDANGFEAAYLVLDGSKDYFNMMFNKDISDENQENYVLPISLQAGSGEGLEEEDASGGKNKKFYINLWDLLKEFKRFLEDVKKTGQITGNACVFSEKENRYKEAEIDEDTLLAKLENEKPLASLDLSVDKQIIKANGEDKVIVTITGYDEDGNIVGERSNYELLTLKISDNNILRYTSADQANLINGTATFTLKASQTTGSAVVSVSSKDTNLETLFRGNSLINSNSVKITSSGKNLRLTSYVYYVPDGMEELLAEISGSQVPADITPEVIRETPIEGEGEREPLISTGEETAGGEPAGGEGGTGEQPAGGEGGRPVSRPFDLQDFSDIAPQGETITEEITDSQGRQVQVRVRRFVDGYAPMSDSSANAPMDKLSRTLLREFINQVLYYSTRAKEISDILKEHTNWEQFYINTEYYQKYLRPVETWEDFYSSAQYYQRFIFEPENPWEEIFSNQKYYERYLQEVRQESRILLAAVASDLVNPVNGEVLKQVQDDRIAALASDLVNPVNGEVRSQVQDDRATTGPLKTLSCPLSDSLNPFVDEMLNSNSMFSVENSNSVVADELILTKRG
ncbi:MAG: hypothetical protein WC806_06220, partial [Candidatus Gracilibacteria bacterium]